MEIGECLENGFNESTVQPRVMAKSSALRNSSKPWPNYQAGGRK